ncbi:MAG: hypothetical protein R3E65_11485 [Steroidobacteraceae bacterium]
MLSRLNARQAAPTAAMNPGSRSHSAATAASTTKASTSTAKPRIGRSRLAANRGQVARTNMPSATGSTINAATSTTLPVGGGTYWSWPRKYCIAASTITGSVNSASALLTAVSVMFSATSPCAR